MAVCWVMVVVDSLAPPVRLLTPAPAAVSAGQRTGAPPPKTSLTRMQDAPLPPQLEALSLSPPPARGAGFTGSNGLEAGELHQLLQLAPSPQTHN